MPCSTSDGGTNTATLRNDAGGLRLQATGALGITLEANSGAMFTNSGRFELGQLGSGDRPAYVDFHASGAANSLDYSARLVRYSGVNGTLELINTGTGDIYLTAASGVYRFNPISGGSGSSYVLNAALVSDIVQTAGSHQIRQYVDTGGNAINGTIGNTALQFRTNNVTRMSIEGATPAVYFIGTNNTTYINYTASQATLIRCGTSSGFCSIGDNACTYVSVGNLTTPLYLNGISNQTYYRNVATVFFQRGESTLSYAATSGSFAHGLGDTPDIVMGYLQCTTAEWGYAVGDRVPLNNLDWVAGNHGYNFWFNNTNIGYMRAGLIVVTDRGGAFPARSAAAANWQLVFRYYRRI